MDSIRLIFFVLLVSHFSAASAKDYVVSGYYENRSHTRPASGNRPGFTPAMIDTDILTDIYFAFAGLGYITKSMDPANPRLTGDFTIQPLEAADQKVLYPQIMALKARSNSNLKVYLSVGGWGFNDPNDPDGVGEHTYRLFSQMASTEANRKQFIESAIAYAHKYGFDGLDIDWEYPGHLQRGGTEEDFDNFLAFLKECSVAFRATTPSLMLSYAAAPFVPYGVPQKYRDDPDSYFKWIAACAQYLDRVNIMTYDYHGPFDVPKITGANSPLARDTNPDSTFYIARTLQYYLSNGVPAEKMVLGLPTFGHSFSGVAGLGSADNGPGKTFLGAGSAGSSTGAPGFLAYFEISDMVASKKLNFGADTLTSTAYASNISSKEWVSFDTPETIKLKALMAVDKGLAGVMVWAVNLDEYFWEPKFPNIRSAWDVLHTKD